VCQTLAFSSARIIKSFLSLFNFLLSIFLFEFLADDVGLKEWATHLPTELSGGQKQRVAIARAMVGEPKVLLADEPTGALDSKTSKEVMDLIQKINKAGKTILVVTHEQDIAEMCSRIVKLKDGVIVEDKKIRQKKAL